MIAGRIRKLDCSQVTDGAAVIFLASEPFARAHADRTGKRVEDLRGRIFVAALLEPQVIVGADAGQRRQLRATQAPNTPPGPRN